jgi:glucose-6-phosphate 1-dehydrogenase
MSDNPFADPLRFERRVPECAIVIFGANGESDAAQAHAGALYRLAYDRRLSTGFAVIGTSRTAMTDEQFPGKNEGSRPAVLRRHFVR